MTQLGLAFTLVLPLLLATSARADDAPGLVAFRTACKAPDAVVVVDVAAFAPQFGTDPDWPFNDGALADKVDALLFDTAFACDDDEPQGIEWTVVDRIVSTPSGTGTRLERPTRKVAVQQLAGTKEIRVVVEPAYAARKAFLAKGGDARDWLKEFFASRADQAIVAEEVGTLMSTIGMPPTVRVDNKVITFGLSPASTTVGGLDVFFVRLFDLALRGKPSAPASTTKPASKSTKPTPPEQASPQR